MIHNIDKTLVKVVQTCRKQVVIRMLYLSQNMFLLDKIELV